MTSDMPLFYGSQSLVRAQSRVLGLCWILYGVLRLAIALWLVAFTTNATLMFGALLTRVPDPFSLMTTFHFFYAGLTIWSAACGLAGILAGFALLTGQRFARILAIVAAVLSLPELPFGIMLGVYTLIVELPIAAPAAAALPYVAAPAGP
jgi:hypothetical protein